MPNIASVIASELAVREQQVQAAIDLLDGGSTVPFIARYRKEATGMLDDTQLRTLEERLRYLREMEARRTAIIDSIKQQGKMTPELEAALLKADSKARLEDIYLPFKEKRRTKAQIAREAGLEPLADLLLQNPDRDPQAEAAAYVKAEGEHPVADVKAALEGARAILVAREVSGQSAGHLWRNLEHMARASRARLIGRLHRRARLAVLGRLLRQAGGRSGDDHLPEAARGLPGQADRDR